MARVFLSHATPDKPTVRKIAAALRAAGHEPWVDEDQILIGESIPSAVERGLRSAEFVVVCISRAAAARGWVEAERDATIMQQFHERKERILPVRLEDVAPPYLIASLAYVDVFPDDNAFREGFSRLLRSIESHEVRRGVALNAPAAESELPKVALPGSIDAPVSLFETQAPTHRQPEPVYANDPTKALSEQLENARVRQRSLRDGGLTTGEVDREILDLRRQLREGGQLRAGDSLGADGRYLLIRQQGRGGFGIVWEAYDRDRGQRVAVKVLHGSLASDPLRRQRFFRGARSMESLNHEAIVRVLSPGGEDHGFYYYVMEYVDGRDFRRWVLEDKPSPLQVLRSLMPIADALASAHARGLVHRDVKPANILVSKNGEFKLTDFDLVMDDNTTGGTRSGALGTFIYAAPELMLQPQHADARADVYAFGMTALFGLHGVELAHSLAGAVERTASIEALGIDARLKKLLRTAVSSRQDLRFPDAGALHGALRAALESIRSEETHGERRDLSRLARVSGSDEPSRKRGHGMSLGCILFLLACVGIAGSIAFGAWAKAEWTQIVPAVAMSGALIAVLIVANSVSTGRCRRVAALLHDQDPAVRSRALEKLAELSHTWLSNVHAAECVADYVNHVAVPKGSKKRPRERDAEIIWAMSILTKRRFTKEDDWGPNLSGADLSDLSVYIPCHSKLFRVDLTNANLSGVSTWDCDLVGANLAGANLSHASLTQTRLMGVNLAGATLVGAVLRGCDISGATLDRANLVDADLSKAKLAGASLRGASLVGAKLVRARLGGALLHGADLSSANLDGADLLGARYDPETLWPPQTPLAGCVLEA